MATRLEKVVLDLEDRFTGPMARATAATAALSKELHGLDGASTDVDRSMRPLGDPNGPVAKTGTQSKRTSADIDRFSGRLRLLADTAMVLGPALVPIGAVGIPAIAGLATMFGTAALAGGTMVLAFQGVGTALEAVNKAQLEPTVENLQAAHIAMQQLGPDAASFVRELQAARPELEAMRNAAAAGMFPGLEQGLNDLLELGPGAEQILFNIGEAVGNLGADAGASLAGPDFREFFDYLGTQVPSLMERFGQATGNVVHGLAELFVAFDPLNQGFADTLLDASRAFEEWASGLADTQGFQEFVAYIRDNGPRVADAMGAIGSAMLDLVEAAAPMGGPTLEALTALARIISAIADSPAGPPLVAIASGLALVNRAMSTFSALKGSAVITAFGTSAEGAAGKMSKLQRVAVGATSALAGLAIVDAAQGGMEDFSIGLESMTQSLLQLQGLGDANLPENLAGITDSIERLADPNAAQEFQDNISDVLGFGGGSELAEARGQIEALDGALARLVQTGHEDLASNALDNLGLSEDQMADLLKLMPQYAEAIRGAANESELFGKKTKDGFDQATSAAQEFRNEIEALNRVLERRSSVRDYEASLDAFTKGLKENGRTFDINTEKGRANQAALDAISGSISQVAQKLKGSAREEFLTQARQDARAMQDAGKLTEGQLQRLLDQINKLDGASAEPEININAQDVFRQIQDVWSALNILDGKTATTYVRTVRSGGMGPQEGYATGGYTGNGAKYEPAGVVHRGEYVFSSEATRGNLAYLEGLHKQLKGYASGGYVSRAMERSGAMTGAARASGSTGGLSLAGLTVRGTLDTPWGPAQIAGIVDDRIADHKTYDAASSRHRRGRGPE